MRRIAPLFVLFVSLGFAQLHKIPVNANWFPSAPGELSKLLDQAFATAAKRTGSAPPRQRLLGLIAPHAALPYSGAVAAAAYRLLDHPKNVIVLAISHSRPLKGITAPLLTAYATPLGEIRVNRAAIRELKFPLAVEGRLCDHSLENQLPFVQRAAPGASVIPLYIGDLSPAELAAAARKLATRVEQGDVVVASSDLTHYGEAYGYTPFPLDKQLPLRLRNRAMEIFERIGSLEPPAFDAFLSETKDNLCGWGPIRLLMATMGQLRNDVYVAPLDYMASGELTRNYALSARCGALPLYPPSAFTVDTADGKRLVASARQTLDRYLTSGRKVRVPVPANERDPALEQRVGVFVTLKKEGQLRGCIGTLFPVQPLWEEIADRTLAAASEDPRFSPVAANDGPISLEISILTPLKRIAGWRQFRIGQGGVILLNGKSGTILPQIASEMHWNREQFLENLSLKAGLDRQAYRDPRAQLYVYSAQVITESDGAGNSGR
ncbi:MAG: AmmeMemoRadiSam system protein B [Acidobacteria bacterium]|nr:AmmeMemoRadiSam system protein B [Acidobacteriota bacterium]